jgi:hypothetical protein
MTNQNTGNALVDAPIKEIVTRYFNKKIALDAAALKVDWIHKTYGVFVAGKGSTPEAQDRWKNQYLCNWVLDTLLRKKGSYKAIVEISEKSRALTGVLDQIENDYSGKRMTLKRITDPGRASVAEKLLKARVLHRKKLAQTA